HADLDFGALPCAYQSGAARSPLELCLIVRGRAVGPRLGADVSGSGAVFRHGPPSLIVLPFRFVTQCQPFGPLLVTDQVLPYLVMCGLPSRETVSSSSPKMNLYWLF